MRGASRGGIVVLVALAAGACSSGDTHSAGDSGQTIADQGASRIDGARYDVFLAADGGADLPARKDLAVFGDLTGPDSQAPDSRAPDSQAPDSQAPDSQAPDAQAPDAQALDAQALDAQALDSATDGPVPDAGVSDTTPPPSCADVLGALCTQAGGQCGPNATCLLTSQVEGVCTCSCTPDSPSTPGTNEDSCPGAGAGSSRCGEVDLASGSTQAFCFQTCQPKFGANDCNAPLACDPTSTSVSGSMDIAICAFFGCKSNADCPVTTGASCDTALTGQCASGQTCLALVSGNTAGVCVEPGTCDTASGLCAQHASSAPAAKIGAPCASDKQCGPYMTCELELDEKQTLGRKDHGQACGGSGECCGSCNGSTCQGSCAVRARNGYCMQIGCAFATGSTLSELACPSGSTCSKLYFGGACLKTCSLSDPNSCRGNGADRLGDYECRAWNNVLFGTIGQVSITPVCEFGNGVPCDTFSPTSGLDCGVLGGSGNPSNMRCRLLDGTDSTARDAAGFCLDDTASGAVAAKQFGEVCSTSAAECASGLSCVALTVGAPQGYCSKPCSTPGSQCSGVPAGTFAGCVLSDGTSNWCAFLCALSGGQTFSCPATLQCDAQDNPPGSGQKPCVLP